MKKIYFIIAFLMISVWLNAQNGFQSINPEVTFNNYAIDQDGNYWLYTTNKFYKYNETDGAVVYDESNCNIVYSVLKSIIINEDDVYIVTDRGVFLFNRDDPSQCADLGFDGNISKVYLSNGELFLFATTEAIDLKIYVYNGTEWMQGDQLPYFVTIKGAAYYNGMYYLSLQGHGVYSYDGKNFVQISEIEINDMQVWKGVLWFVGSQGIYNLTNDSIQIRTVESAVNGGLEFQVMNGELWVGAEDQIKKVDFDRIQAFQLSGALKALPSCNPEHEAVELAIGNELYTFNEAQYISDPTFITPENLRYLDVNNVEAGYNARNSFFWDFSVAQYKVPKDGVANSLFASSLWFGGKDAEGDLHVSSDRYAYNDVFIPGPLRLDNHQIDDQVMHQFNRIWKVDRATVENFKYRYENGEVQNGNWPVDYDIESWPANGPEGYAENLAPFVDVNEDGVYNPMDGDYPDIEGDQMLYWIANDNAGNNVPNDNESDAPGLGLEIHFKAWANEYDNADSDELEALNNSTFLDVEIINRSDTTYTDFYSAIHIDSNLGNSDDDYVGCDVMNHSFYFYNGDLDDNENANPPGYGLYPPAQSVTILDAPVKYSIPEVDTGIYMSSFMYHQRGGDGEIGDPHFASDYYNYMTARWKDSANLTFGGNGVDATDVPARYMYPGDSDPYNIGTGGIAVPGYDQIWTNPAASGFPFDVRGVAANGPYTLAPGESVTYRFAFVWARDNVNTEITASAEKLRSLLPAFHQWQREGEFPSNYNFQIVPIGINNQPASVLGVKLYPNPANNAVTLTCDASNGQYKIYSLSGQLMKAGQIRNKTQSISLDQMNPGLYVVQITNGEISVTEKLIVEF